MDISRINPKANLLKQEYADGISEFMDLVLRHAERRNFYFIRLFCFRFVNLFLRNWYSIYFNISILLRSKIL